MTYTAATLIISQGKATAEQIDEFFAVRGKSLAEARDPATGEPLYSPDGIYRPAPIGLGEAIIAASRRWGSHIVNHDIVAAQILKESAGWQSEYARERNNPSGLGAITGNPDLAHWFDTPEDGILTTVAHLLTYAAGPGPWTEYDSRASATPEQWQGVTTRLVDLDGRWASPGQGYGASIAGGANALLATVIGDMSLSEIVFDRLKAAGLDAHDIRDEMPYNGGYTVMPRDAWIYTAVHHTTRSAIPTDYASERDSWIRHARYHIDDNGWPGIAYGIGFSQSGRVWILRDLNLKGYHAYTANGNTFATAADIGLDQQPSDEMRNSILTTLRVLHDETPELPNLVGPSGTYGHHELAFIDSRNAGTECPGHLLQLVVDYRNGLVDDPSRSRMFDTGFALSGGFLQLYESIERGSGKAWAVIGVPLADETHAHNGESPVTVQQTDVGYLQYNANSGEVRMATAEQEKEIQLSLGIMPEEVEEILAENGQLRLAISDMVGRGNEALASS